MALNDDEFRDLINKIHSTFRMEVEMEAVDGQIVWTAKLFGDDFLDGKWYKEMSGISRSMRAMTRRLNNFKYEKRKR